MGFYLEVVLVGTKGQAPNAQDPKEPKKHTLDGAMIAGYRGVAIGKTRAPKICRQINNGAVGLEAFKNQTGQRRQQEP